MPMPTTPEPSPPPGPRRRRSVRVALAAGRAPGWYAGRVAVGDAATTDRDARRLVTAVAGLRAGASRTGDWGAAIRGQDLNAWLATDLPRNHAAALPTGIREPRVVLEPGRIRVAARAGAGPLAGTVSLVVEPRLRAPNQLELAVSEARFGAVPIPAGPFVHRVAAVCGRLGLVTNVRRLDGRSVVVVSWGGRGVVLRGLSVNDGELVIAGTTEEAR